jgi:hypothetical protein
VRGDLTPIHFSGIRRLLTVLETSAPRPPDDLGGYVRIYEVAERIRRGAPL